MATIPVSGGPSAMSYAASPANILGGAGIEAGGSIVSSIIGAASAAANRDWQEKMSDTAHQREVKDLRAAGINPVLTAMGGSGATTPQGNVFTPDNPLRGFAQNYLQYKGQNAMQQAQLDAITQANAKSSADAHAANAQAALTDHQNDAVDATVGNLVAQSALSSAHAQGQHLDNALKQMEVDFYTKNPFSFPIKQMLDMFGVKAGNVLPLLKK